MPRKKGQNVLHLEQELRRMLEGTWNPTNPLPVTRDLAEQFNVSNVTVHRVLRQLSDEGAIWRNDNGRYFLLSGREHAERPRPVICLIRELAAWSSSYRLLLQGFSKVCAEDRRSLVLPSDVGLVWHESPEQPPVFAGSVGQLKALHRVIRSNELSPQGFLLDHLWHEDVLEHCSEFLRNAVVIWRTTRVSGVSSVSIDFDLAARQVVKHLLECGYEKIIIAVPFEGDLAVELMRTAAQRALKELTTGDRHEVCMVSTPHERTQLVEELHRSAERVGIFCLEDNVSRLLLDAVRLSGIKCPENVGIVSGMGTEIAHHAGLSTIEIPFVAMGAEAARIINARRRATVVLKANLLPSHTSSPSASGAFKNRVLQGIS